MRVYQHNCLDGNTGHVMPLKGNCRVEPKVVCNLRRQTRMTIVALVRHGAAPVIAPEPHERLEAGDRLIVIGRPEDLPDLVARVVG